MQENLYYLLSKTKKRVAYSIDWSLKLGLPQVEIVPPPVIIVNGMYSVTKIQVKIVLFPFLSDRSSMISDIYGTDVLLDP